MKRLLFTFLFFILIFSCGTKTESGKVVDIIYPSDNMEVSTDFFVLVASLTWRDTFIFNPLLFGKVKTIKPEGLKGKLFIDGKLIKETSKANHHIIRIKDINEGKHTISFKTKYGEKKIEVFVKKQNLKFIKKQIDLKKIEEHIKEEIVNYFSWIDKKRYIRKDGFRLVQIIINKDRTLLIWKKIHNFSSFFRFSIIDHRNIKKEDLKNEFSLPDEIIYGYNGELFLAGLDIKKKGAVVSCGDSFLFRILKDETVLLYRLYNDGSVSKVEITLYNYVDKNDKLMTPAYKYPNYYHISCADKYVSLSYPVYGDYNLDYKTVILKNNKFLKSFRFTDFDNFKFQFFLSKKGSVFVHKIPDRILTREKHRFFYANETIKEILIPVPFDEDYYFTDKAYVDIKGNYFPPKILLESFNIDKIYISVKIFGKRGTFLVKEL